MTISTFENGPFSMNSYILTDNGVSIIIDPGKGILETEIINPAAILITHAHIDHVEGVNPLLSRFPGLKIIISADSAAILDQVPEQARMFGLPDPGTFTPTDIIEPDKEFTVGPFTIMPIPTPGHCPGSLSFLIGQACFTGDALFKGTIGRTDLPGGDASLLLESIMERLLTLPEETVVYPGHGPASTIALETKSNPWLRRR